MVQAAGGALNPLRLAEEALSVDILTQNQVDIGHVIEAGRDIRIGFVACRAVNLQDAAKLLLGGNVVARRQVELCQVIEGEGKLASLLSVIPSRNLYQVVQ